MIDCMSYRPVEPGVLLGNPAKAKAKLCCSLKTDLMTLVDTVLDADMGRVSKE